MYRNKKFSIQVQCSHICSVCVGVSVSLYAFFNVCMCMYVYDMFMIASRLLLNHFVKATNIKVHTITKNVSIDINLGTTKCTLFVIVHYKQTI